MDIICAASSTTCCSSCGFPLEAPMPSLSQARTMLSHGSLNREHMLPVCPSSPAGSSQSLPPWSLRGAMEQGCRAQPCAEAAPIQPSLRPKAEIAASQLTGHFLHGARRSWTFASGRGPGKALAPLFSLGTGGRGAASPRTLVPVVQEHRVYRDRQGARQRQEVRCQWHR